MTSIAIAPSNFPLSQSYWRYTTSATKQAWHTFLKENPKINNFPIFVQFWKTGELPNWKGPNLAEVLKKFKTALQSSDKSGVKNVDAEVEDRGTEYQQWADKLTEEQFEIYKNDNSWEGFMYPQERLLPGGFTQEDDDEELPEYVNEAVSNLSQMADADMAAKNKRSRQEISDLSSQSDSDSQSEPARVEPRSSTSNANPPTRQEAAYASSSIPFINVTPVGGRPRFDGREVKATCSYNYNKRAQFGITKGGRIRYKPVAAKFGFTPSGAIRKKGCASEFGGRKSRKLTIDSYAVQRLIKGTDAPFGINNNTRKPIKDHRKAFQQPLPKAEVDKRRIEGLNRYRASLNPLRAAQGLKPLEPVVLGQRKPKPIPKTIADWKQKYAQRSNPSNDPQIAIQNHMKAQLLSARIAQKFYKTATMGLKGFAKNQRLAEIRQKIAIYKKNKKNEPINWHNFTDSELGKLTNEVLQRINQSRFS